MPKSTTGRRGPAHTPATGTGTGLDAHQLGRWALVWFCAVAVALVHVTALVVVTRHVAGELPTYATLALPALILLVTRPQETLRRGYRWLAVWAIALSSIVAAPALLISEAWVLRQTWLESGGTLRRPSWWPARGTRSKRSLKTLSQT